MLSLAQAAHDERSKDGTLDPHRLAVLSDALEEAGCLAEEQGPDEKVGEYEMCGNCNGHGNDIGSARYPEEQSPCWACGGTGEVAVWRNKRGKISPNPLLAHLRGPGPHYRGCHVLDVVLRKE